MVDALARRRGNLYQRNLARIQRLRLQQLLESFEALQDSLGVVQPVDAQNDAVVAAEFRTQLGDVAVLRLTEPRHVGGLDGDRERAHANGAAIDLDAGSDVARADLARDL